MDKHLGEYTLGGVFFGKVFQLHLISKWEKASSEDR